MWERYKKVIVAGAIVVLAAICFVYFKWDPATGMFPRCIFKQLTGWDCPGCGTQRAIHALMHGEVARALHYNAALPVALMAVVVLSAGELSRKRMPRFYRAIHHPATPITILVGIVAWTIARNVIC